MGYALIWIESLAAGLLLIAVIAACTAHWSRGQRAAPVVAAFLLAALAATATSFLGYLYRRGALDGFPFAFTLSWSITFAVGALGLLVRGLKHTGEDGPAARAWPRARLALALGALLLVDYITFTNMDLAVKVQMASIRAEAGARILALSPPHVSDSENAAIVYQQAFEALTPSEKLTPEQARLLTPFSAGLGPKGDASPGAGGLAFDPKDKAVRQFLDSQRRGIALLRKAAAMPNCWFDRDYSEGLNLLLPELQQLRYGSQLLILETLNRAANGDSKGALQDVALLFRMANHIDVPLLISLLVKRNIEANGFQTLKEVLNQTTPGAEDLAVLSYGGEGQYRKELQRALQMEEAVFGSCMAILPETLYGQEVLPSSASLVIDSSVYRVFFLPADLASYRGTMRRFQRLAGRPYHEVHKEFEAFERSFQTNRGGVLAGLLVPATAKVVQTTAVAETRSGLARIALAMTAYRIKKGKFPDKLEELAPEELTRIPTDPFDGEPLRMKREGKDVLLYSVAIDRAESFPGGLANRTSDLMFRLRGK